MCFSKSAFCQNEKSPIIWSCLHIYGSSLTSALVTTCNWGCWGTQFVVTGVIKLIQLAMQDCQSQCKQREKVDSSFSSSSCSLPLTKHEIVPWVSLRLFQKIPVWCSHHVCSNLCVCTELGKWLIGSHQSSQVIEIKGKKGQNNKSRKCVCCTGGTVVVNALCQAGQRQCWVTRVCPQAECFSMEPDTAWLTESWWGGEHSCDSVFTHTAILQLEQSLIKNRAWCTLEL